MYGIEDEAHAELHFRTFDTREDAIDELERRAAIPWNEKPNVAPCTNWRECGRRYYLLNYDSGGKVVAREFVLEISANGIEWHLPLPVEAVLRRYEHLPAFFEIALTDVNQVGRYGERPLDIAATRGDVRELNALLAGGADINGIGELGNTPLHEAVAQRHVLIVKRLLECGARTDIRNEWGQRPFDMAAKQGWSEIYELLRPNRK